jgi:hypothetical protein
VSSESWLRVPIGNGADRWVSRTGYRTVLAVVHNPTALTRLLDLLAVLEGDHRIQVLFTVPGTSVFSAGLTARISKLGGLVMPWAQAVDGGGIDLAIATSKGTELHQLSVPIVLFPHGIGYNKLVSREPGAGSREQGAGSR